MPISGHNIVGLLVRVVPFVLLARCQGADTSTALGPGAVTARSIIDTDDNVVRCQCDLEIPDVYTPGCLWVGGSDQDGYCHITKRADICYPPELNPRANSAGITAHPPTAADLDAFCDSRSSTVVSSLNLITGMCPLNQVCPQSLCAGTVAHCHAVRNDDGTVFGYVVRPACDQDCAPIPVRIDDSHHAMNIGTSADSANYVQAPFSCTGEDTPVVCRATD